MSDLKEGRDAIKGLDIIKLNLLYSNVKLEEIIKMCLDAIVKTLDNYYIGDEPNLVVNEYVNSASIHVDKDEKKLDDILDDIEFLIYEALEDHLNNVIKEEGENGVL